MQKGQIKLNTVSSFESFLMDHGFITKPAFERIQKIKQTDPEFSKLVSDESGQRDLGRVTEILLREKLIEEEDLTKARAAFLHLPYIDLHELKIAREVQNLIPEESRHFYKFVPFEIKDHTLKVAVIDPTNLQALEALEFLGQKQSVQIQLYLASSSSIEAVIGKRKNLTNVVGQALKDIELEDESNIKTTVVTKASQPTVIQDAPIIKIVNVILTNAIEANASDIHIEPTEEDLRVRYRIDGILHTSLRLPKTVSAAITSRIKILCNLKIDETRLPQDGRFHLSLEDGQSVDLRVSTLPIMSGEKVVMRILDKSGSVPTLEQLGIRGKGLAWIQEHIKKTNGIFLITGPTGSGKSTTLYALLSILNTTMVNIVTLEDPVEYFIEGVNQSQINPEIGLTFATGLRSILRQDPNIVMVGEIRDEETAELAVHAALTGHLVFSTLHTNNAVGAMPRLMNMGIEPFLLEASVNLIVAQRLTRKICEYCKKELEISPLVRQEIDKDLKTIPDEYLQGIDRKNFFVYTGGGCAKCGQTGYKGRVGIYEVLPLFPEIQALIFKNTPQAKIYETALKFGMITLRQDGIVKVLRGETTLEEIIRVTKE